MSLKDSYELLLKNYPKVYHLHEVEIIHLLDKYTTIHQLLMLNSQYCFINHNILQLIINNL